MIITETNEQKRRREETEGELYEANRPSSFSCSNGHSHHPRAHEEGCCSPHVRLLHPPALQLKIQKKRISSMASGFFFFFISSVWFSSCPWPRARVFVLHADAAAFGSLLEECRLPSQVS
jgi:hypothetical protein